ncbi:MAG: taurine ABC transporter substrate-binding protein, partial [Pseudomonadota bacterium]|nr:taurine ABC transporter substrate-binding protein [Pseudomonadota bacterium]
TRKFAKENPEFMVALVKALAKADADYRSNPKAWTADPAKVAAVAKLSGGKPEEVADAMALYGFPSLTQQASAEWLGGGASGAASKALAQQANFLKEQGRLTAVVPDYSKNVSVEWVTRAMK